MSNQKNSADDTMTQRFYKLNFCVTFLLLIAIFVSIHQFGGEAWQSEMQIALVLPGDKNQIGWNKTQHNALKSVCENFEYNLVLRENVPQDYDSGEKIVEELAQRGINAIVFSNGLKIYDLREFEKRYPNISFYTIENISVQWGDGNYSILSFEGSYLAGILAGLRTKTNKIGYIAPYSDAEVNQGINAFTLGVKRVNPDAEVLLNWTGSLHNPSGEVQAVQNLKAQSVDVLTYHQNGDIVPKAAERAGIYFIAFNESYPNSNYFLSAIKIDWNKVYSDLVKYNSKYDSQHTSYTFGIAKHLIDFEITDKLSTREKVAVEEAKWELKNGRIIFSGDIFDRNDIRKCSANEAISFQNLQKKMDWLIKGVRIVGS